MTDPWSKEWGVLYSDLNQSNSKPTIFPNPSSGIFHVTVPRQENILKIEVFNSDGQLISNSTAPKDNPIEINLTSQISGIYNTRIIFEDGVEVFKLIKN
jgi:hypothetical protein